MNRTEAAQSTFEENKLYRTLSIGTMAVLQQLGNKSLAALMGNGRFQSDYEDFIVFLFVHTRDYSLGEIRGFVRDGNIVEKAYTWVDEKTPYEIAEGVDWFTKTETKAQLVQATTLNQPTEKKTSQVQTDSSISEPCSDTILTTTTQK